MVMCRTPHLCNCCERESCTGVLGPEQEMLACRVIASMPCNKVLPRVTQKGYDSGSNSSDKRNGTWVMVVPSALPVPWMRQVVMYCCVVWTRGPGFVNVNVCSTRAG